MKKLLVLAITFFSFFILISTVLALGEEISISNCSVLDEEGKTYVLAEDIINSTNTVCMNITANNIILDCQGHTISGVDASDSFGIWVYRDSETTTNITIKNCILTDWDVGLFIYNSNSNTLSSITANNNIDGVAIVYSDYNNLTDITANSNIFGVHFEYSDYNNLTDITANNNTGAGIHFEYSNSNNLTDITSNSIEYGIILDNSNSNTLSSITANSNHEGIRLVSSNSNNLTNITANFNFEGIRLIEYSLYNNLTNINVNDNEDVGLFIYNSNSNTLSSITANNNIDGVAIVYSDYNNLTDITANNNTGAGIHLDTSSYNTITNSIVKDNSYGILLFSAGANSIYNNLFNNTNNFYFDGDIYANEWNVTKRAGTNIYNPLGYIGGNYWTNSSGNDFSDTCLDANSDGFCDNNYTLATDNIDYLPIAKTVGYGAVIPPPPIEKIVLSVVPVLTATGIVVYLARAFMETEMNYKRLIAIVITLIISIALISVLVSVV
jgi:parallel beta-helix repeat protein